MVYLVVSLIVVAVILFIIIKPYFIKYDTICGYTGGLGSGKSFLSSLTAVRLLKKNRFKTKMYNLKQKIRRKPLLEKPMLYSSIPIRISKKEMSKVLTADMLTLQESIVKGSVVYIDEVDVFANQFAFGNHNIIECASKKELTAKREGKEDYDSGLFDEYMRLFRHLWSSEACESRMIVNTQATSNITTIIRRRMNTVFVLSRFRIHKIPILCHLPLVNWLFKFYTVECRNITITDEITNTSDGNTEDNMRIVFGFMPPHKLYDTHCYKHRSDTIPSKYQVTWKKLTTERLLKAPIDRLKNKSKNSEV